MKTGYIAVLHHDGHYVPATQHFHSTPECALNAVSPLEGAPVVGIAVAQIGDVNLHRIFGDKEAAEAAVMAASARLQSSESA